MAANVPIFFDQGGALFHVGSGGEIEIESGGSVDVESGGALKVAGVDKTAVLAAAIATPVAGVAAGYKIARDAGVSVLGGSNPTVITTGLSTVIAVFASLRSSTAPGASTSALAARPGVTAGTALVYAWKPTQTNDSTLVASTGQEEISWFAVGT